MYFFKLVLFILFKVEFQHTSDDGSVVSFDFREQESKGTTKTMNCLWCFLAKSFSCL
jgi:hypothetical protein